MKTLSWLALILIISPIFAFGCLMVLYPVGSPEKSPNALARMLDLQATYWIRNAIPVPPPLLVVGLMLSAFLWWRHGLPSAVAGTVVGVVLLGFWTLIMLVPLLLHVN
jgi:hypothetical protein